MLRGIRASFLALQPRLGQRCAVIDPMRSGGGYNLVLRGSLGAGRSRLGAWMYLTLLFLNSGRGREYGAMHWAQLEGFI
jgi:hypothetical protein